MTTIPERRSRPATAVPPVVFVAAVALLLTFRFMVLISRYSVNLLFGDQWDFLAPIFVHDPAIVELFFLKHGPHREGVGLIADKFLYPLIAWNSRFDSFFIGGCIVAAMLLGLVLKERLFGRLDYSDAVIPIIFLTLAQYEGLVVTPNPAYAGFPLLLVMLYLLALLQRNDWLRYGSVLAINFLLIYTGFGLFMGVVTIGVFALVCYQCSRNATAKPLIAAAGGLLIACVSLASFFARYRFQSAVDCFVFPYRPLGDYPWFMALMFSTFAGIRSPIVLATILGAILLLLALFGFYFALRQAIRRESSEQVYITIVILVGYAMLFAVNAAIGRICLGLPAAAQSSRYTTLLIPAFLAMYFYLLTVQSKKTRDIGLIVLALVLIPGHVHVSQRANGFANGKRAWASCYKRTEDISYCDAFTGFMIYPDPERTRLKQKLDYLKKNKLNLFAE